MKSKLHLSYEQRKFIALLLRDGYKLKEIARELHKSNSTISREIKRNRVGGENNTCEITKRYPFVCSTCKRKTHCKFDKFYYNPEKAHTKYKTKLSASRRGIDMTVDEVEYWNNIFEDRIKIKGQPTSHIFEHVNFPKSLSTFYRYVDKGIFRSIHDEMMPRMFSFKKRNRKQKEKYQTIHKDNPIRKNRTYTDFKQYLLDNPNTEILQMDTVHGKREDKYVILTIYFCNSKLMLMYLVEKYNPEEIINIFSNIKKVLGLEDFKKLFKVILTDNGWEFSKPQEIEIDFETGEKLSNIFYTDPYSSWQKGALEKNHEFIRYIIPKSITFDNLSNKNVVDMMNHINNITRTSLNGKSPYDLFVETYSESTANKLKLRKISSKDVTLTYKILK